MRVGNEALVRSRHRDIGHHPSLLQQVVGLVRDRDEVPATPQDLRFVTKAPLNKRSVVLAEDAADNTVALVATVIGAARQGIVDALPQCAQRGRGAGAPAGAQSGCNWPATTASASSAR